MSLAHVQVIVGGPDRSRAPVPRAPLAGDPRSPMARRFPVTGGPVRCRAPTAGFTWSTVLVTNSTGSSCRTAPHRRRRTWLRLAGRRRPSAYSLPSANSRTSSCGELRGGARRGTRSISMLSITVGVPATTPALRIMRRRCWRTRRASRSRASSRRSVTRPHFGHHVPATLDGRTHRVLHRDLSGRE